MALGTSGRRAVRTWAVYWVITSKVGAEFFSQHASLNASQGSSKRGHDVVLIIARHQLPEAEGSGTWWSWVVRVQYIGMGSVRDRLAFGASSSGGGSTLTTGSYTLLPSLTPRYTPKQTCAPVVHNLIVVSIVSSRNRHTTPTPQVIAAFPRHSLS